MNTTYFKDLIMGNIFKTKTNPEIPSSYYIGLSSTTPNPSGGNVTEPSTNQTGYSRVKLTSLSTPTSGAIINTTDVRFNESLKDWFPSGKPATHYVIFDAATGGHLLMYNPLIKPKVIEEKTIAIISSNNLHIKLLDY